MGRVGSRKEIARWEGEEESPTLACILSVRRASGKEDDCTHVCHIVNCKLEGNSAVLQQRFTSLGPEDPEGKSAAIGFALSTASLTAFRAFLFERPEFWSSRSGDGFNASCLTQGCFTVFVSPRKNTSLGLRFTAAICRLQNGCLRSISFRSNSEQVAIERVTKFLRSSKCRSWVHRVLKRDLTFASELDSLPATCKCCGESEHPAYSDQKSQQASEDYMCSACLTMEKEVILAIRLEEQSEDAENWEKVLNEHGSVCMEDNWEKVLNEHGSVCMEDNCDTCCICGCEDNEELDDLVPCACKSSQAVVHMNCAAACTASPKISNLGSTPLCFICGRGQGIRQNGGLGRCEDDGMQVRVSKRPMNSTQVAGVEVKRPRTSSTDGVMQVENIDSSPKRVERESNMPAVQIESKDADCSKTGPVRHGWRSADVPAVVPFKKRRIQIVEVPRSPTPPPKQMSPKVVPLSTPGTVTSFSEAISVKPATLLPMPHSPKPNCLPLNSTSSNATSLLPGSSSPTSVPSSKSATPVPRLCSPKSPSPQPRSSSPLQTCPSPRSLSPKPTSLLLKLPVGSSGSSPSDRPKLLAVETAEQSRNISLKPLEERSRSHYCGDPLKVIKESHTFYMGSSANQNQPSSSQEVEDGELVSSTEKDLDDFEVAGELPEVRSQDARGHYSQSLRSNPGGFHDDRSGWDLNTDMDTWDKLSNKVAHAKKKMEKGSRTACESITLSVHMSRQIVTANETLENSSSELVKGDGDSGKHGEYGISLCQQVDANSELLAFSKVVAGKQSEGLGRLEIRNNAPGIVNSAFWKEGEETCEKQGQQRSRYAAKPENQASLLRTKMGEWDELEEEAEGEHVDYGDYDCRDGDDAGMEIDDGSLMLDAESYWRVEDTMGDPSFWESKTMLDGGGSERKQIEPCTEKCSTSGRVKCSGWDQLPEGFDSAEEALKAAQEIFSRRGRGSWVNPGGRGSAQGPLSGNRYNSRRDEFRDSSSQFGDRCVDEPAHGRESYNHMRRLDNSIDDFSTARGRGSGRGSAGVHGRGRFNGWSDNQQSVSLCQWGPGGRHRSSSGFSSQGATNAAAVAAARVESSGFVVAPDGTISRGGRPSRVLRSTFGNSRGARGPHTNGQAPPIDVESGPNFPSRMDRHMGRSSNIGTDMGVQQGAGSGFAGRMSERGALAGRGNVDRYGGSSYSGRSADLRRSESPRRPHPSDRSFRSSRTPYLRPEARVTRSRMSPPSPEPFGFSKFFPVSARGQRSPPPFPKWSHDRREAESFRERDFKRPVPRSHGSSGRTSPHVVHGSSLMDERDWRVLAGTRSSPGARGGLNSSVHSGKSMDGRIELHRSRQAEEEEHTHSISRDSDHGRTSPREVDRDRDTRGSAFKRDRSRDDDKKIESYRLSSRSTGAYKRASSRDEDDEIPPRRHRPSW